ncbi:hypothetical protein [Nonomuraea sp. NPDC049480]|uniref:hypothetical protein n=1 Tax=Nonomuraea sp. NPDC049480 TaxID=3364353 RepID=UPI0037887708
MTGGNRTWILRAEPADGEVRAEHRTGRYVLYARTAIAEALLERPVPRYFDETPTPRSNSR